MGLCSFLAVFFPGLLVGGWSSYLVLRLWSETVIYEGSNQSPLAGRKTFSGLDGEILRHSLSSDALVSEHQKVPAGSKSGCNVTAGLSTEHGAPPLSYPVTLLVLIHSTPAAVAMRNSIRQTWLKDNQNQLHFVGRFVIGIANLTSADTALLACENIEHRDMLFLPSVTEPAKAMGFSSSKKLLESFLWAMKNANFRYIFKCTDSTFARLPEIASELVARNNNSDLLWGFFAGGIEATREGNFGEKDWYLCTHYLPYPEGGGYVISRGLVSILSMLSEDLEHYVHDDIALGVWFSPFNGIERRHDVRFNTGLGSRGCNNVYLVTHKETASSMLRKYLTHTRTGSLCEKEFSAKPSYRYNWKVPFNKCCIRESGVP